ncbi:MAG: hypothetical protein WC829_02080 [Hyphomicrobium sp.]|jgi:hypothetical protein
MLTLEELQILMPVIDAGIKAAGIQIFQNPTGGIHMQSAIAKLQQMADEASKPKTQEQPNG